jgi:hypothetical protein
MLGTSCYYHSGKQLRAQRLVTMVMVASCARSVHHMHVAVLRNLPPYLLAAVLRDVTVFSAGPPIIPRE